MYIVDENRRNKPHNHVFSSVLQCILPHQSFLYMTACRRHVLEQGLGPKTNGVYTWWPLLVISGLAQTSYTVQRVEAQTPPPPKKKRKHKYETKNSKTPKTTTKKKKQDKKQRFGN